MKAKKKLKKTPRYNLPPNLATRKIAELSARELFAAMMLQSFVTLDPAVPEEGGSVRKQLAELAVEQADALIAALNQPTA